MAIVGGFDLHRRQITFEYLDTVSGEVGRGRVAPADREHLRVRLRRLEGQDATFAVEAWTGWRFVVEELERVGAQAHLAEPVDTAALRGPSPSVAPVTRIVISTQARSAAHSAP